MGKDSLGKKMVRAGEKAVRKAGYELDRAVDQIASERGTDDVSREVERDVKQVVSVTVKASDTVIESAEKGYKWGEIAWGRIKDHLTDITL